ncbi:MAG: ferredoxin [Halioglobus sp.]|nr:ferredoxin [Halioglobus sp.]|tara:strand:+ start:878 stop:1207 length:330 start_codon:yes stop_codon:yes gene_type:complete
MKYRVAVVESGEAFLCAREEHLLQGMQSFRVGTPLLQAIPVGCRGGGCGVCRIRVLSGDYETRKMSRKHIAAEDQARGIVLACRVSPRSDLHIQVLSPPAPSCTLEGTQ